MKATVVTPGFERSACKWRWLQETNVPDGRPMRHILACNCGKINTHVYFPSRIHMYHGWGRPNNTDISYVFDILIKGQF